MNLKRFTIAVLDDEGNELARGTFAATSLAKALAAAREVFGADALLTWIGRHST